MASIKVRLGTQILEERELIQEVFTIGREAHCDLQIENLGVSAEHAQISRIPGTDAFLVEDLGSANGTYINGKRANRYYLNHNDEVLIGKHLVVFKNKFEPQEAEQSKGATRRTFMMDASALRARVQKMKGGTSVAQQPDPEPILHDPPPAGGGWKMLFMVSMLGNVFLLAAVVVVARPGLRDRVLDALPFLESLLGG